jgi:DNA repair protein RadC
VRDLPVAERPRERLAEKGAEALTTAELVALLLGSGTRTATAFEVADQLVAGGLRSLAGRSLPDLERTRGLGRAQAARLLAALELGARVATEPRAKGADFSSPASVARYLRPRYSNRPVETFGILCLDVRRRLRRDIVISIGCLTSSLVHPREVFQEAVLARAAGIVAFHNHPSGDPEPSAEDMALTRRLADAGRLMGIELVDHIVLGADQWVSFKERGLL